jgi:hypothetical protein
LTRGAELEKAPLTRPLKELLLAPHSKRSGASDPIGEANTNHKVWTQGYAFLSSCRIPKFARTKCTGGNWRAGEQAGLGPTARDTGAAPLTHEQARHACCSCCAQTRPVLQLEGHVVPRCAQARASEAGRPEVREAVWGHLSVVESEQWATRRATERASRERPQTSFREGGAASGRHSRESILKSEEMRI